MDNNTSLDSLLEHPIPVLSNGVLLTLMEAKLISIDPFDAERLGPTAYRICPHRLRFHFEDEEGLTVADRVVYLGADTERVLRPGEYAVVSPRERITIEGGFVADFFPSSWCIENRLVVTAGRLDAGYNADLVFGVYNAGRSDVVFTSTFQLARVSFGWMGRKNMPVYTGSPPGAYIPQLAKLREREAALNGAEEDLRRQRDEIAQLRDELLRKSQALEG